MENENQELKQCQNCNRKFPEDKIELHEAYCFRNFRKCLKCGSMVDKNYLQDHEKQFHATVKCQFCERVLEASQQIRHLQQCENRPEICAYCENQFPKRMLEHHLESCGSRTKQCELCKKLVSLKDEQSHLMRCKQKRQKQKKQRRQRRQSSQNPRTEQEIQLNHLILQRQLYRQNSTNQINMLHNNLNRVESHKGEQDKMRGKLIKQEKRESNQRKPRVPRSKKNYIEPEIIKPILDPVPISIRMAIKVKEQKI